MKFRTRVAVISAIAFSLAVTACEGPASPPASLAGQWQAARDPAQTIFEEANLISFSLTQTDGTVTGTWGATGAGGAVVVRPDQVVTGTLKPGGVVELALGYDRVAHGCTGSSSECYALWYRLFGEITATGQVRGRVIGPPHPWLPDSELPVLAEWTLERR